MVVKVKVIDDKEYYILIISQKGELYPRELAQSIYKSYFEQYLKKNGK